MHACWLLLAGAGEFTLKLLQLRNPRFVSVAQSPVTVVDPMHPELPRVLADLDQWTNSDDTPLDLQASCHAAGIAGTHPALMKPLRKAVRAAPTDIGILILGESGTGKELVAHALHRLSPRAQGPFIPVHCAALSPQLLESELFGH
ncbi:MAG: sigma 54-interacting transcriptional regulator, partial [Candidatus Hydrogenedentes bacterium]|nr:sigma 54-interacting transcriptional regulator [Candidatus Hydrogenedentota bacterium]